MIKTHGTISGYNRGCRCAPCVDGRATYRAKVPAIEEHGAVRSYQYGCRCALCREAWRVYCAERKEGKHKRKPKERTWQHGQVTGWSHGCRCAGCLAIKARSDEVWASIGALRRGIAAFSSARLDAIGRNDGPAVVRFEADIARTEAALKQVFLDAEREG